MRDLYSIDDSQPKAAGTYVPGLDGLRAVAVMLVIFNHLSSRLMPGGTIGVDLFFVLSGYLITSILLREHARVGTISLRSFYARRMLRLMPALVLVVAADAVFTALFGGPAAHPLWDASAALSYTMDFVRAFTTISDVSPLGHTWSLSIEEQFYVIWPFLLILILKARSRLRLPIVLGGILAFELWKAHLYSGGAAFLRLYFAPDTRADELLIGCALAVWTSQRPSQATLTAISKFWPAAGAAILLIALLGYDTKTWLYSVQIFMVSILTAVLIVNLTQSAAGRLSQWLSWRPLVELGKVSYGVYLWHYPFLLHVRYYGRMPIAILLITVAASIYTAFLSYKYVEGPFLRLKQRYEPGVRRAARGRLAGIQIV